MIDVKRNPENGGFYAFFNHNGKFYYADVTDCYGNECMIFPADENEKVTDWLEVYVNYDVEVTEKDLIRCIEDFCGSN